MSAVNLELGSDGILVATMDVPGRPMNVVGDQLMTGIQAAVDKLAEQNVKGLIITSGKADFCAGGDLDNISKWTTPQQPFEASMAMKRVLRKMETQGKPVVAAINGHALGGGCEIAMGCHIRILKETARMGQTESNLGIIPGYGGTQRTPRLIGRGLALEHLILGTQISAAECHRIGLVNRLAKDGETLNDARALARELGKRPPIATRLIIEAVDDGLEEPIDKGIEIEIRAFEKVIRTEDAGEGLQAFFQKRPPEFKGK
jgi:enoyl-CoA hydratase/carnithine racemase